MFVICQFIYELYQAVAFSKKVIHQSFVAVCYIQNYTWKHGSLSPDLFVLQKATSIKVEIKSQRGEKKEYVVCN